MKRKMTQEEMDEKLFYAVFLDRAKTVRCLLNAGANPNAKNEKGEALLHRAYDEDVAKILLDAGADPNAKNNDGDTPLHQTAKWGREYVAKLLISAGTDLRAKNKYGWTPLHYAANESVAKLLLDAGVDPNANSNFGHTPLHYAASHGSSDVVRILIDSGAKLNAKNKNGETPLHVASALYGDSFERMVKGLIEVGANPTILDDQGRLPEDVAKIDDIRDFLRVERAKWEARELAKVAAEGKADGAGRRRI